MKRIDRYSYYYFNNNCKKNTRSFSILTTSASTCRLQIINILCLYIQLLLLCTVGWTTHGQQQVQLPTPIRINVGGEPYLDRSNQYWRGDENGIYLNTTSNSVVTSNCPRDILGTNNDMLYCSYRWFRPTTENKPYRYTIPVIRNYKYTIRLHFAELYFTIPGKRIFDIYVNDVLRYSNFDVLKVCKDQLPNTAFILTTTMTEINTNGVIRIEFIKRIENPMIQAIEIIPIVSVSPTTNTVPIPAPPSTNTGTTTTTTVRINVGGDIYRDPNTGYIWQGDNDGMYLRTKTNSIVGYNCPEPIQQTNQDDLYCSYRWFRHPVLPTTSSQQPFQYNIPVQQRNVRYTIQLHFAELYFTQIGQRMFDIYVEGSMIRSNFDVVQQSMNQLPKTAVIVTYHTDTIISDGMITIEFVPKINHPLINAIEIIPYSTTTVPQQLPVPISSPQQQQQPFNIRINLGSATSFTDINTGKVWLKDDPILYGVKGSSKTYGHKNITHCSTIIQNTLEDRIYCTQRYYIFPSTTTTTTTMAQYNVPVPTIPNGGRAKTYDIILHFAEIYYVTTSGLRVFNVLIEGNVVSSNLDIYQKVGSYTAYTISSRQQVADGYVTIDFQSVKGEPAICAIEVVEVVPSTVPVMTPTAPIPVPVPIPVFTDILINCGGDTYIEVYNNQRIWGADRYYIGGSTYSDFSKNIVGTEDDPIYETERYGEFQYEIPVPVGSYQITLHFAETRYNSKGRRLFHIDVEGKVYQNVDLYSWGGMLSVYTLDIVRVVEDGTISLKFMNADPIAGAPKVNGISITHVSPHYAHSVSNGPYVAVDINNTGSVSIPVDGSNSHTHGPGLSLNQWIWKKGSEILAKTEKANLLLPVGQHSVALTVVDTSGNAATETTTITVLPYGFPSITKLIPNSGLIAGNEKVIINGSGFTYSSMETTVNFGRVRLTDDALQIVNANTIIVKSPGIAIGLPVQVTVQTPLGTSSAETFTYVASSPISFTSRKLVDFGSPTVARFGPDKKLYIGTLDGKIGKLTLDVTFTRVISQVVSTVAEKNSILGLAFDPLDNDETNPPVYCTASFFFHGESKSSSGGSINGRILKVGGANLDVVETIIKGLPVSDHDHGLNGIYFGDNGELYIQTGSNTNGGVPGPLSGSHQQKENFFSSATIVAELSDPLFQGIISYDKEDDGRPYGTTGIDIFASGIRNGYSVVLHSNGYLYGTDNGPNSGYGKMLIDCEGQFIEDSEQDDRINLIQRGKYYGHPNPIRAALMGDTRQCTWRAPTSLTNESHEGPLSTIFPSAGGIIEYEADFFDKQLRNNLIVSRYKNGLFRIILSGDGKSIIPDSIPPIPLVGAAGLDVTMAPNGNLIEIRLSSNSLGVHIPNEMAKSLLQVYSVFPRRGSPAGGNTLTIYGNNFGDQASTKVLVGGRTCALISITIKVIDCILPGGPIGMVNIVVIGRAEEYIFQNGYRYITGFR